MLLVVIELPHAIDHEANIGGALRSIPIEVLLHHPASYAQLGIARQAVNRCLGDNSAVREPIAFAV